MTIKALQAQVEASKNAIVTLTNENTASKNTIVTLTNENTATKSAIETLSNQNTALTNENTATKSAIVHLTNENNTSGNRVHLKINTEELDQLRAQSESAHHTIIALTAELAASQKQVQELLGDAHLAANAAADMGLAMAAGTKPATEEVSSLTISALSSVQPEGSTEEGSAAAVQWYKQETCVAEERRMDAERAVTALERKLAEVTTERNMLEAALRQVATRVSDLEAETAAQRQQRHTDAGQAPQRATAVFSTGVQTERTGEALMSCSAFTQTEDDTDARVKETVAALQIVQSSLERQLEQMSVEKAEAERQHLEAVKQLGDSDAKLRCVLACCPSAVCSSAPPAGA